MQKKHLVIRLLLKGVYYAREAFAYYLKDTPHLLGSFSSPAYGR